MSRPRRRRDIPARAETMDALRLAAEAGDAGAMNDLGATYALGSEGLPQDDAEAFRWFTRSADAGWSLAKLNLAGCYRDGRGCDVDDARAMALYVEAASNPSDPAACDAMERIGEAYRTGTCGVTVDHAEAARWFRRGAEAGSVECAYRRGVCLATGEGVAANERNAVEAFRVAAASGHAGAALDYGHCLMRGIGVATDKKRACRLYAAAAAAGHAEAMFHLGMAHLQGRGATQQERLAEKWLLAAAEAGHPEAMLEYARLAATGAPPGVEKNTRAATEWYARAADAGVAEAAAALGAAHCAGIEGHVVRDLAESERWFELALRLGMPEAAAALKQVGIEKTKEAERRDALEAARSSKELPKKPPVLPVAVSKAVDERPKRAPEEAGVKNTVKNTRELPACIAPEGAVSRKPRPQPRAETMSRPAAAPMNRRATVSRTEASPPKPAVEVKAPSQGGSGKSKKPKDATASHPDSPYAAPVARRKKNLTVK